MRKGTLNFLRQAPLLGSHHRLPAAVAAGSPGGGRSSWCLVEDG